MHQTFFSPEDKGKKCGLGGGSYPSSSGISCDNTASIIMQCLPSAEDIYINRCWSREPCRIMDPTHPLRISTPPKRQKPAKHQNQNIKAQSQLPPKGSETYQLPTSVTHITRSSRFVLLLNPIYLNVLSISVRASGVPILYLWKRLFDSL